MEYTKLFLGFVKKTEYKMLCHMVVEVFMNQAEFLSVLRESLEGNIPKTEMEENLRYYRELFEQREQSDKELCEELGEPRLIAKSLIDAYLASKGADAEQYKEQARSEYSQSRGSCSQEYQGDDFFENMLRILSWVVIGMVALVILVLLLRIALVILVPLLLVVIILKIVQGRW